MGGSAAPQDGDVDGDGGGARVGGVERLEKVGRLEEAEETHRARRAHEVLQVGRAAAAEARDDERRLDLFRADGVAVLNPAKNSPPRRSAEAEP